MSYSSTVEGILVIHWLQLIQAEYRDMPGLSLTRPQMQRLWGFGPEMCSELIDTLVKAQILKVTASGTYVIGDFGR